MWLGLGTRQRANASEIVRTALQSLSLIHI